MKKRIKIIALVAFCLAVAVIAMYVYALTNCPWWPKAHEIAKGLRKDTNLHYWEDNGIIVVAYINGTILKTQDPVILNQIKQLMLNGTPVVFTSDCFDPHVIDQLFAVNSSLWGIPNSWSLVLLKLQNIEGEITVEQHWFSGANSLEEEIYAAYQVAQGKKP